MTGFVELFVAFFIQMFILVDPVTGLPVFLAIPLLVLAAVFVRTFLILRQADRLMKLIGDLGATIATRIMGLVLAFLAVQYVIDGVTGVWGR